MTGTRTAGSPRRSRPLSSRHRRPHRAAPAGDAGATAVLVLALAGLLSLIGATTSAVTAVAVARQRAAAVADLAALAGAEHALEGEAAACGRARRLAAEDEGRLRSCRLLGDVVEVVSEVRPPGPLGRLGSATARARAGPAEMPSRRSGLPSLPSRQRGSLSRSR